MSIAIEDTDEINLALTDCELWIKSKLFSKVEKDFLNEIIKTWDEEGRLSNSDKLRLEKLWNRILSVMSEPTNG